MNASTTSEAYTIITGPNTDIVVFNTVPPSTGSHLPCQTSSNSSSGSSPGLGFLKKKAGSIIQTLTNLVSGNNIMCINCQKNAAKFKCATRNCCEESFCSPECHLEAYQRYQVYESGKLKCKLQGCNKLCYVENNGKIHEFCTKSHAEEYQTQLWELKQKQQYLKLQHQHHQQKQQQEKSTHERLCKFPECKKPCFSQNHEFCGKTHADMYKPHYNKGKQQKGPRWSLTGPIFFYNRDEEYYEFTNFALYHVTIDYKDWPTTEHYFQAQKFVDTPYEEAIRRLLHPREAFDFSRKPEVSRWRRSDWERVKEDIMYKALLAKFTQHESLCHCLLGTGNRMLVEHTKNDSYWGDGGDGTGKNRLGNLLMKVRKTLRQPPKVTSPSPPKPMPAEIKKTLLSNPDDGDPKPTDDESHKTCNIEGHEPMDTSGPLSSPEEPLINPHSTVYNKQTSSPGKLAGSPTTVVIQNPSAFSTQDAGDSLEKDMGTSQATNESGSSVMNGGNSDTPV